MTKETADYIDPMIGAITEHASTWAGLGKTYPGAWLPSGLVQLGPDTVTGGDNGSGYSAGGRDRRLVDAQLFDLLEDPYEQTDLHDKLPKLVASLTQKLDDWYALEEGGDVQ